MLHLVPVPSPDSTGRPYAEAVSRLASVRHAMRLVEPFGHGPASDPAEDEALSAAWDRANLARRQWFDNRSQHLVGAAAEGLEALLAVRQQDREPHAEASKALAEQIRRELADVARVVLV